MERTDSLSRSIWDGKIPLQISLDNDELSNMFSITTTELYTAKSSPLCIFAPRCGYLPFVLPQIRRHFSRWISKLNNPNNDLSHPWFSANDEPLNWHYPTGLLHDLMVARCGHVAPFKLTIHFSGPYPSLILPFTDPDVGLTQSMYQSLDCTSAQISSDPSGMSLQSYFYSMLKQADCLRFGTCKRMMNLAKSAQCQLWDALWTHNYGKYWAVNEQLVKSDGGEDGGKTNFVQRVPLRCYVVDRNKPGNDERLKVLQWPVRLDESTIDSVVADLKLNRDISIFLHGINILPETPMKWLVTNLPYPDNFLHLVIIVS